MAEAFLVKSHETQLNEIQLFILEYWQTEGPSNIFYLETEGIVTKGNWISYRKYLAVFLLFFVMR